MTTGRGKKNDRLFITETQKSVARVHEVPGRLLDRLWEDAFAVEG